MPRVLFNPPTSVCRNKAARFLSTGLSNLSQSAHSLPAKFFNLRRGLTGMLIAYS